MHAAWDTIIPMLRSWTVLQCAWEWETLKRLYTHTSIHIAFTWNPYTHHSYWVPQNTYENMVNKKRELLLHKSVGPPAQWIVLCPCFSCWSRVHGVAVIHKVRDSYVNKWGQRWGPTGGVIAGYQAAREYHSWIMDEAVSSYLLYSTSCCVSRMTRKLIMEQ